MHVNDLVRVVSLCSRWLSILATDLRLLRDLHLDIGATMTVRGSYDYEKSRVSATYESYPWH